LKKNNMKNGWPPPHDVVVAALEDNVMIAEEDCVIPVTTFAGNAVSTILHGHSVETV
jgi:hypothetical protein